MKILPDASFETVYAATQYCIFECIMKSVDDILFNYIRNKRLWKSTCRSEICAYCHYCNGKNSNVEQNKTTIGTVWNINKLFSQVEQRKCICIGINTGSMTAYLETVRRF